MRISGLTLTSFRFKRPVASGDNLAEPPVFIEQKIKRTRRIGFALFLIWEHTRVTT